MSHTVFYARVSTADQTIDHQVTQAKAAGYKIDTVISDNGVSGVSTKLVDRPEGRRLYDVLRRGDVLVVRWVDRLGRNYADVTEAIRHFMGKGVIIRTVINNMTFDGATTNPMEMAVRDAMIAFLAATAQAQSESIREAQLAGIAHAKQDERKYLGRRPSYTRDQLQLVQQFLAQGKNTTYTAAYSKLSRQTVLRIKADPAGAEAILAKWDGKVA